MSKNFIDIYVETGKFCLSSYKCLQKFLNLWNCIFSSLKDKTLKCGLFTNFKMLFPIVPMGFCYLAYIKIPNNGDKGLTDP